MIHCWPTIVAIAKPVAKVAVAAAKTAIGPIVHAAIGFGKRRRHYMRHAWNLSHRGAKRVYYGTVFTCVVIPSAMGELWRRGAFDRGGQECCVPGQFDVVNVYEPSSAAVLAVGLLAVWWIRRQRYR